MLTVLSRNVTDDNKMKPPVPTSKSTASMVDDPFVVLDTASTSGSASLGRSTNPLEDLEKPANSEGKAAANSLFEEPITFDQAPKSDCLFASEVNSHAKATTYSRFQAFRLLISSTITFFFFLGKVLYLTFSNCIAGFQALDEQYYKSWLHRCPALGKPVPFCNL